MNIIDRILNSSETLSMPIAVYPGLKMTGDSVQEMVTNVPSQLDAITALHKRYNSLAALTAMDLSVEAEAFGAEIEMSEDEVPSVTDRLLTEPEMVDGLEVPELDKGRCKIGPEVIAELKKMPERPEFLVGGIIGPYTLAARLYGVSEALELTLLDPEAAHKLLSKTTEFVIKYALAYKEAGADALCMAEPAAGLLWPEGLAEFSSRYVREIVEAVEDDNFKIILHNCGCRIEHLSAILESGAQFHHFGEPMDIPQVLEQVPSNIVISGNLDPSSTFLNATADEVKNMVSELLEKTSGHRNFLLSSGCDIPPNAKLENLDAFYAAAGS